MEIIRCGTSPSRPAPSTTFTGRVRVERHYEAALPSRARASSVTFEPAARTYWHTHPLGQMLIITAGCGRVQSWGHPVVEVRAGDVVWFPPEEKHWHGGGPTTAMTHIAIAEPLDGKTAEWLEEVTDTQYLGEPKAEQ
jgi:quercetin dioxygenase-like cupin family protein